MIEPLETLVLGPDDRLVVVFPAGTNLDDLEAAEAVIEDRGFVGRVLICAGVEQLAVLRGDPS